MKIYYDQVMNVEINGVLYPNSVMLETCKTILYRLMFEYGNKYEARFDSKFYDWCGERWGFFVLNDSIGRIVGYSVDDSNFLNIQLRFSHTPN